MLSVFSAFVIVADASSKSSTAGGTASASLRRIKKEYKDAVEMGIAYDWINQRLIIRKKKSKSKSDRSGETTRKNNGGINNNKRQANILCLGPIQTNLRQWHFSFRGAGEGVYSEGIYHGQIVLPKDYPMSPPSVQLWTPSGRFVPHKDICLSASNYHPESWTPRWSIHGIVNALRLHMLTRAEEIGGIDSTPDVTREHARKSLEWKKTWKVRGGTGGAKWTRITVDHQLLVREGVLGTAASAREDDADTDRDETRAAKEGTIGPSAAAESVPEPKRAAAVEPEMHTVTESCEVEHDSSRIQPSANLQFPNDSFASMFHLVIINYMTVFAFLNR